MSLLTICQQVANSIPVAAPITIFGNTDQTALLLLASAQDEGEALARRPNGGWVNMIAEYDFSTTAIGPLSGHIMTGQPQITGLSSTAGLAPGTFYVSGPGFAINTIIQSVDGLSQITMNNKALQTGTFQFTFGQSDYTLPADFERPVDNTFWDRSRFWSMRGPQSPQEWQLYKSSVIGKASIQRRYRFRRILGKTVLSIDPTPFDNGSSLVFEYVSNAWCQNATTGAKQSSWQADTDIGILDEYLMRLGIKWRVLSRLGMAYVAELDEYERQVEKALGADGGAAILNLVPSWDLTLLGPWNIPETGFGNVVG